MECKHANKVPEQYRGSYAPNPSRLGESRILGAYDGFRCLDCKQWLIDKSKLPRR